QPLTPAAPKRAGEAYLLYQDARFLLVRRQLLRAANRVEPATLLGGYYEVLDKDEEGDNVIYRRTMLSPGPFQTQPETFLEDLAHVSYVQSATVNGSTIAPDRMLKELPWLSNQAGLLSFNGRILASATFGSEDEPVHHLNVEGFAADAPATLDVVLKAF